MRGPRIRERIDLRFSGSLKRLDSPHFGATVRAVVIGLFHARYEQWHPEERPEDDPRHCHGNTGSTIGLGMSAGGDIFLAAFGTKGELDGVSGFNGDVWRRVDDFWGWSRC